MSDASRRAITDDQLLCLIPRTREPALACERLTDMRHILKSVGILVLLVGVLAACADPGSTGGTGGAEKPKPTPSATTPPTELTISVTPDKSAPAQVWTLSCQPAAGTHPKAADACAFVTKASADLLAPVPAGQSCTQIFGGPAVATVKGTWRGTPVNARLARNNGCELARWNKLKALIGEGNA